MVLPALDDKNLAKDSEENDKNMLWPLNQSKRKRNEFEKWRTRDKQSLFKNSLYDFRSIKN